MKARRIAHAVGAAGRARKSMSEQSFDDWLEEEEERSPGFIASVDEEALKLAVAAAIKKIRNSGGITQRKLAAMLSTPQSTIARIEIARAKPNLVTLQRIATALGYLIRVSFEEQRRSSKMRPSKRKRKRNTGNAA